MKVKWKQKRNNTMYSFASLLPFVNKNGKLMIKVERPCQLTKESTIYISGRNKSRTSDMTDWKSILSDAPVTKMSDHFHKFWLILA